MLESQRVPRIAQLHAGGRPVHVLMNNCHADDSVHGILLQHPVPKPVDKRAAFEAIAAGGTERLARSRTV